jgi:hypothetical protein
MSRPVADLLQQTAPEKRSKWPRWIQQLAEEDIETEKDVLDLPDEDFGSLPVSAALKGILRKFRLESGSKSPCIKDHGSVGPFTPDVGFSLRVLDAKNEHGDQLAPIFGLQKISLVTLMLSIAPLLQIVEQVDAFAWSSMQFAATIQPEKRIIPEDQAAAINLYTAAWNLPEYSLYSILNKALREKDRTKLLPFFSYLKLLLTALLGLPRHTGAVWRGVKADLRAAYPKGTKRFWWAFSSCTREMQALENDLFLGKDGVRTLFRVENCTRAVDIQPFSSYETEAEVLLIPGAYLEVTDVGDLGHGLVIITLKQIKPPFEMLDFEWGAGSASVALEEEKIDSDVDNELKQDVQDDENGDSTIFAHLQKKLQGMGFNQQQIDEGCKHGETIEQVIEQIVQVARLKELAEQGNVDAQRNLAMAYENGTGVTKDQAEAVRWWRKLAEKGDAAAQDNLGYAYLDGEGVAKDHVEAARWWRKAAEQGWADAQYNLGIAFNNGWGVEKDEMEARSWWRKAAEQGNVDAQRNLGLVS